MGGGGDGERVGRVGAATAGAATGAMAMGSVTGSETATASGMDMGMVAVVNGTDIGSGTLAAVVLANDVGGTLATEVGIALLLKPVPSTAAWCCCCCWKRSTGDEGASAVFATELGMWPTVIMVGCECAGRDDGAATCAYACSCASACGRVAR